MYKNRLTKDGLSSLDQSMFSVGVRLPNCTAYCLLEYWEQGGEKKVLFSDRATYKGFPNAKEWYSKWNGRKSDVPIAPCFLVWGNSNSTYGHVAFCYEVEQSGNSYKVKVSQSNYGGNYFETKQYTVQKGKTTTGVGMAYIGACYLDLPDLRVSRDESKMQYEVNTEMLRARKEANGEMYAGQYIAKGIYNVVEKNGDWVKLSNDTWCGIVDGNTLYTPTTTDYKAQYNELKTKYDNLSTELESVKSSLEKANDKLTRIKGVCDE